MSHNAHSSKARAPVLVAVLSILGLAIFMVIVVLVPEAQAARGEDIGKNISNLIKGWIEPLFYAVLGLGALFLSAMRRFTELAIFLVVMMVVAGPVLAPRETGEVLQGLFRVVSGG